MNPRCDGCEKNNGKALVEAAVKDHPKAGDPDADMLARFREGDEEAFSELIRRHRAKLIALIRRILWNHDAEIDDVFQEALMNAFQAMRHFRGEATFSSWLYRIVTNACLNELRRSKRHENRLASTGSLNRPAASVLGLERMAEQKDYCRFVYATLQKLSPGERRIILLSIKEELPHEEIARIIGVVPGTVKSRLHRAREKLKAMCKRSS